MNKRAISVTLSEESIVWLRAKTLTGEGRSLSDTLDRLVLEARGGANTRRSIVGSAVISADDPKLERADAVLQDTFAFPRSATKAGIGANQKRGAKVGRRRAP